MGQPKWMDPKLSREDLISGGKDTEAPTTIPKGAKPSNLPRTDPGHPGAMAVDPYVSRRRRWKLLFSYLVAGRCESS